MDISAIDKDYYLNSAASSKTSKLSGSLKNKDMSNATDEELMDVCKQFEAYFVEQVLKQAKETFTQGTSLDGGSYSTLTDFYKDSLMQEYASTITDKEDLGLAKTLYEQMKRNYSPSDIPLADKTDDTSAKEAVSTSLSEEE